MSFLMDLENYNVQQDEYWPSQGRVILSQSTDESVIVYQTTEYESQVGNEGKYDRLNGTDDRKETLFKENDSNTDETSRKCENEPYIAEESNISPLNYSLRIETSFVKAMYNCGWGKASGYERVLATLMRREGFEEILHTFVEDMKSEKPTGDVSIKWVADRSLTGDILDRFVPEVTIRGNILSQFYGKWTISVKDITKYVDRQRRIIESGHLKRTWTPKEVPYISELSKQCTDIDIVSSTVHDDDVVDDDDIDVDDEDGGDDDETNDIEVSSAENSEITLADVSGLWQQVSHSREAILYLYGAFNPIHMGHVNALLESKRWLETTGKYTVCATRIAIACDSNIKHKYEKSGDLCIKFEHRLKLCQLACKDHHFISVYPFPLKSQSTVGDKTRNELNKPDATLVPLMGSDRACLTKRRLTTYRRDNKFSLCVGRQGMSTEELKTFEKAEQIRPMNSYDFFAVPTKFNEISSTKIRQKLSKMVGKHCQRKQDNTNKSRIIKELTDLGWITESEGEYIFANINTMFF